MQAMQQQRGLAGWVLRTFSARVAGVQEQGCWALKNLAWDAENRKPIAAKGGIEAIVKRTPFNRTEIS